MNIAGWEVNRQVICVCICVQRRKNESKQVFVFGTNTVHRQSAIFTIPFRKFSPLCAIHKNHNITFMMPCLLYFVEYPCFQISDALQKHILDAILLMDCELGIMYVDASILCQYASFSLF